MRIALIPARSGSKRIKNKNIREFCGKPLIAYSIELALASNLFDEVVVSTDCQIIAELATSLGAKVPFIRPDELADDFCGTREVINHGILALQALGWQFDYCCCIYATSPLLQMQYLQQGFDALEADTSKAFAFSVTHFDFPVQRAIKVTKDGIAPMYPEFMNSRSQDLDEAIHDAGQFYWGRTTGFLSEHPIFSRVAIPILLPRYHVQDIDTEEDWIRAELMYKVIQQHG